MTDSPRKRQRAARLAAKAARATPPKSDRPDRPRKPTPSMKQRRRGPMSMSEPTGIVNLKGLI
jgi:hypothetical protein